MWVWGAVEAPESTVQGWFPRGSVGQSLMDLSGDSLSLFPSLPPPPSPFQYLIHENSPTPLDTHGIDLFPALLVSFSEWKWGTCLWVAQGEIRDSPRPDLEYFASTWRLSPVSIGEHLLERSCNTLLLLAPGRVLVCHTSRLSFHLLLQGFWCLLWRRHL